MAQKISEIMKDEHVNTENLYNEVELNEQEIAEALAAAKQKKQGEINRRAYLKKLNEPKVYPVYTPEQVFEQWKVYMSQQLGENFIVDKYNETIIKNLCCYFTADQRSPYDLQKGIMLIGPIGCGKTTTMQFFRHNQSNSFIINSARQIASDYQKHGADAIYRLNKLVLTSDETKTFGQKEIGICFDDLGTEVDKKFFGNESNVLAEILLNRYDQPALKAKTHITTNLVSEEIGERYGDRVRSRCREMFTQIFFDIESPDRRK